MVKKLIILLFGLFLCGVVWAEPPEPAGPYLPYYWLRGTVTVTTEGGEVAPSCVVYFYHGDAFEQKITAETSSIGTYEINAYELEYYYGVPITFESDPYVLAITSRESGSFANYGTFETIYLNPREGYTEEALVITANGWTEIPGQPVGELSILTSSLLAGTVDSDYLATLEATGGTRPYAWTAEATSLPPELALSRDGVLTGTLISAGTYEVVFSVTDSSATPSTASRLLTIEVGAAIPPGELSITTSSLPSGTVSTAYIATLEATGGTPPYAWTIEVGSLPSAVVLDPASGTLSGLLAADSAGSYRLRFAVNDASGTTATRYLTVEVYSAGVAGPQINLKVYLEGLYAVSTATQTITSVVAQVFTGESQASATHLLDSYGEEMASGVIDLNSSGQGQNGVVDSGGVSLEAGDYYLVIKQKLAGEDAGPSHLPVLVYSTVTTDGKIHLEDGSTVTIDLTDPTGTYRAYTPSGLAATVTTLSSTNKTLLRAGNFNGDSNVNVSDFAVIWKPANGANSGDAAYDIRADVNLDGRVQIDDFVLWKNNNGVQGQELE